MTIVYATATYGERIGQTLEGVKRIVPGVDHAVILVDQTVTEEQKEELRRVDEKVRVVDYVWRDNFPAMRNAYNDEVRKIDPNAWVVVSDPDEVFNEEFVKDLPRIVEEAEKQGIGLCLINSHDRTIDEKGEVVSESISNFFKNLVFHLAPEVRYEGVGTAKRIRYICENCGHEEVEI